MNPDTVRSQPVARVLVVQPDPSGPLSEFENSLSAAGIELTVVHAHAGEAVPTDLDADGLIVMGGDMSSLDDADYPWLDDVRILMRRAHTLNKPTLGICLGGQLMAQAFGGSAAVGHSGLEAGVIEVHWRQEADDDRLLADLPQPFLCAAMHGDMVDALPPSAVWLGESQPYAIQAFRVGESAWGLQFHPEIDLARYNTWVAGYTGDSETDLRILQQGGLDFEQIEGQVLKDNQLIGERFAAIVCDATQANA